MNTKYYYSFGYDYHKDRIVWSENVYRGKLRPILKLDLNMAKWNAVTILSMVNDIKKINRLIRQIEKVAKIYFNGNVREAAIDYELALKEERLLPSTVLNKMLKTHDGAKLMEAFKSYQIRLRKFEKKYFEEKLKGPKN